ncbi:tRNA-splicing ligase RtcB [Caloramator quimbayensis]|uniref:3'-phosphate/5'-hydroxy nucleic acid ligase n=1 Tax=Caloramator quimbayensis TaxID=1147123 RepID=A0A1T4Y9S3_9CLOT|nr:tRNA-splicing ligase RtcB [Caloramator quimbayensis]
MSRTWAKNSITLSQYKKLMEGIFTTSVNKETIDECPLAYKPMEEIINNIGDTVDIVERIVPVYNFKAAE